MSAKVFRKMPKNENISKMQVDPDWLLKTRRLFSDRKTDADEFMKTKRLAILCAD
jgi:hypothetical protein